MGALSPRTRNAQVEMYQRGEVDYLVATDAIGMGLNLDIAHVAFSSLEKFDGRRWRHLSADELAQIAGRAGRHVTNGTFGVTGEAPELDAGTVEAIEEHRFAPVRKLQWRNSRLDFGSLDRLLASLQERTDDPWLTRVRDADDLVALKTLAADVEIRARAHLPAGVKLLWEVCRVPDFRGISPGEHANLLRRIFTDLHQDGELSESWFAAQIRRIDRTDGDIDTLSKRLAYIRTWTYVAQRADWVRDADHWRGQTREVEDRLSDALHGALTQRFVDRRTSVLARRLKQRESLVAEVTETGEVRVEGEVLGRLEGFRFRADKAASPDEAKTLARAAREALAPQFSLRADRFYNAPDTEIDLTEQGGLMWGEHAVGRLAKGAEPLKPQVQPFVDEDAGEEVASKVARRLQHWVDRRIAATMEPLTGLRDDAALTGGAKGFAYQMVEAFGILPRAKVAEEVRALDQEARGALRKHGLRFGQFTVFQPLLLKPAPTRLRLVLWGLWQGLDEFPESPPPGLVTVPATGDDSDDAWAMKGYRKAGERAIRIDMLERLADMLRDKDSRGGFEASADMLSITGLSLEQFAGLMGGLGYKAEEGSRPKVKAQAAETPPEAPPEVPEREAPPEVPDLPQPDREPVPDEAPPAPEAPEVPAPDAPQPDAPVEVPEPDAPTSPPGDTPTEVPQPDVPLEAPPSAPTEVPAPDMPAEIPPTMAEPAEMETFYTFTWGGRARREGGRGRPQQEGQGKRPQKGRGKPREKGQERGQGGKGQGGKGKGARDDKPQTFQSKPRQEKRIDPDNPFAAALSGFKTK